MTLITTEILSVFSLTTNVIYTAAISFLRNTSFISTFWNAFSGSTAFAYAIPTFESATATFFFTLIIFSSVEATS